MEDRRRADVDGTTAYYDHNAPKFIKSTVNEKFSELSKPFEGLIHLREKIIDLICRSGRDRK